RSQRIRRGPGSKPLPYTTLFRAQTKKKRKLFREIFEWVMRERYSSSHVALQSASQELGAYSRRLSPCILSPRGHARGGGRAPLRSAEHTSELQSRQKLVCRLLLE